MRGGLGGFNRSLGGMGRTYGLGRTQGEQPDPPRVRVSRDMLVRIFGYFLPYRGKAVLILACVSLATGFGLLPPLLVRAILDRAIPGKDIHLLTLLVIGMVAVPLFAGLVSVAQGHWSIRLSQGIMFDLRNELYRHLQSLSLRFYTTTRSGDILSRVNNDVNAIRGVVVSTFIGVITNALTVIATAAVLFSMDARLALLGCAIIPVFILPTRRIGRVRRRLSGETQEKQSELLALMQDVLNIGGFILMRMFGQTGYEADRFRERNRDVLELQVRQAMVGRWLFMSLSVIAAAGPALIYWYGGWRLATDPEGGGLTVGTIIAFVAYLSNLYRPTAQLANTYVEVQGALGVFARIFDYLDLHPDVEDLPDAPSLEHIQGHIAFENVTFRYRKDLAPALQDLTFDVQPGQLVALVGPSGAGKTTVSYLVPRFYDPYSGRICIDGKDIRKVTHDSLTSHIGMVTQDTFLFHTSVRENLLYARPDATEEELTAAARAAHIHDFVTALPDGYETVVGERGHRLSGGEKQRLAIARAILKDPRILILDEATSSLDSQSEAAIQAALQPLMKGRTTLVVAHRLSTILAADMILVLEAGKLVERGTHAELLQRNGLYAKLYQTQFQPRQVTE